MGCIVVRNQPKYVRRPDLRQARWFFLACADRQRDLLCDDARARHADRTVRDLKKRCTYAGGETAADVLAGESKSVERLASKAAHAAVDCLGARLTDSVLWPATRRAEERVMTDKDTSRRGPVQSNGWLCGGRYVPFHAAGGIVELYDHPTYTASQNDALRGSPSNLGTGDRPGGGPVAGIIA